jgi:tRNA 5-methylaminomethyl-2-thiouridine biosynthesis bifunctional protein
MMEAVVAHSRARARCVVLDTDFQQGQDFIALWDAWRKDASRCQGLHVIAMLPTPVTREQLLSTQHSGEHADLLQQVVAAWPVLTPGWHGLSFEDDRLQLLICNGSAERYLSELVASVDVFLVRRDSLPTTAPAHASRMAKALARLAAEGAVLMSEADLAASNEQAQPAWMAALSSQGFDVARTSEDGTLRATFAPRFRPKRAAARVRSAPSSTRHAVIVGAGLAGSSAACALAQQGWTSTVLDRHGSAAQEASGNAGGLFHGVIHAKDGIHARFNRAASIEAAHAVRRAIAQHGVAGAAGGLLRLESALSRLEMQAVLDACQLPRDHAQAVDAATASQLSGLRLTQAAWHYVEGGWVQPAGLVRSYFERAGTQCNLRTHCEVQALMPCDGGWQLLNAQGKVIEEAEVVVLANATDAARLLAALSPTTLASLQKVRGQISQMPSNTAGLPHTQLPLTGAGYLLPSWQGHTLFGATSHEGDDDPSVRVSDHAANLAQLAVLTQTPPLTDVSMSQLQGRTAWRCVAPDRLPVIGGVPQEVVGLIDQPRLIPRWPGLFVYTALGSRGITWSALGAHALAAWVTGSPSPIEASLLDAIDPARFAARRARGQQSRRRRDRDPAALNTLANAKRED